MMQTEEITYSTVRASLEEKPKNLSAVFIFCFVSTMFAGIASMLMSVYLPVVAHDLLGSVSDENFNNINALINSIFIFGWMFGGIIWGVVCDKIGRSKSVVFSTACYGIFTVLTAVSSTWLTVSVCRFLTGFGIGGVLVTATVLIEELWTDKKKAIIQGMVALAMPVGFFAAGAINNFLAGLAHCILDRRCACIVFVDSCICFT
jgi:MFS family permease